MKVIGFILGLFMVSQLGLAQIQSNVVLTQDTVQMGQSFEINFKVVAQNTNELKSLSLSNLDSVFVVFDPLVEGGQPDSANTYIKMEISEYGNWPANQKDISKEQLEWISGPQGFLASVKINGIIWQPGGFAIPGISVLTSSNRKVNIGEPGLLIVTPPETFTPQDSTQFLADIKTIVEEPIQLEDFALLFYVLGALLLIFLAIYLYRKFKKEEEAEEIVVPEIIRPAHEIAEEKLDGLKSQNLWQQGLIKEYQSKLTFIIREYLENRYDIRALESTTHEILIDLKKHDFDSSLNASLSEILTMADLVKFAKAKPGESIHESFMIKAYELVNETKEVAIHPEDE